MSATQISLSSDLKKLEAEGFRLRVICGDAYHLLVEGIPYVTESKNLSRGILYSNHQCYWIGTAPCDANGQIMHELISGGKELKGDGINVDVGFSRKHADHSQYRSYHEKIWTYVRLIWHEAQAIDPACNPRMNPSPIVVDTQARVFHYPDMATTRAGIGSAMAKLFMNRVAIIGLGGTGSYILDLVAKTPVTEIHVFDGDVFELHNAFRAPGAPTKAELINPMKVDWFASIYDRMRKGIVRHPYHVEEAQMSELVGFDFVFIAIDNGEARGKLVKYLIEQNIPFIDVGMDIDFDQAGALRGMSRVTLATPNCNSHVADVIPVYATTADGVYRNIQVADLNMLNAALAVLKWKKNFGFYADDEREHHSLYTIASHGLTKEDRQ
jgi:ThiF family